MVARSQKSEVRSLEPEARKEVRTATQKVQLESGDKKGRPTVEVERPIPRLLPTSKF
jgi:hypothetical protein